MNLWQDHLDHGNQALSDTQTKEYPPTSMAMLLSWLPKSWSAVLHLLQVLLSVLSLPPPLDGMVVLLHLTLRLPLSLLLGL